MKFFRCTFLTKWTKITFFVREIVLALYLGQPKKKSSKRLSNWRGALIMS